MKQITNWRKATVADIEADALLEDATKIHVLSYDMLGKAGSLSGTESERIKKFFKYHIDNNIPVVMHNGISYDVPLVEKLLGVDLSKLMLIDTLSVSWYLNTERQKHGLDSFFPDYGIAKPKVDDWENLSYEEYRHRCEEDVKINVALWEDFKNRLTNLYADVKLSIDSGLVAGKRMSEDEVCYIDRYKESSTVDEYVDRILTFLMFKADCARLKEKTMWKVDEKALDSLIDSLSLTIETAREELEGVMPKVPKFTEKSRPAKPFKKSGELSASGISWEEELKKLGCKDEFGTPLVEQVDVDTLRLLKGYEPPNINGHQQIKDFLFSKGWKPINFKFVKDEAAQELWASGGFRPHLKPKPRAIPQVSIDGDDGKELCPSVLQLAEKVPEIMAYAKYTTIKHRLDMCKGFKRDLRKGGYLCARVGGYTNCMVADTLILTDGGMKRIVDVTKSLSVLTHEGRYRKVTDLINNGIKPVVRVQFSSGKEITCTPNHKVYTPNGSWVEAGNLSINQPVLGYGDSEVWKEVAGFEGHYVSNWGRVTNKSGNMYTTNRRDSKDIRSNVTLPIDGSRGEDFLISRLVLKAFVGESELHALHKDGNPNNNNLKNLYYGTDADNWAENTYKEQFSVEYVTSIQHLGEVPTFDISVEEDHSYIANGIVVHNTLREQHRELVNLPSVKKPYGGDIRGLLISERGKILLGSDMSSLEDRVKMHFMIPYDPVYVESLNTKGYDPHLTTALAAGLITRQDFDNYMSGVKEAHVITARAIGKSTNYAAVYGSGAETLARTSGMSVAQAKVSLEGYWKLNWSVKAISDDQCVITDNFGKTWLVNPINGFAYSLRSDKDRFSTLCQGTGSFFFDMWVDAILESMYNRFGVKRLNGEFHDEYITSFKDTDANKVAMKDITEQAIETINKRYFLRRKLGCDVQFGYKYSDIH